MNELKTYATKDLALLMNCSIKGLIKRADKEGWKRQPRQGLGGGFSWELKDLPPDVQAAIALAEAKAAPAKVNADGVIIPDWAYDVGQARYALTREWQAYVDKNAASMGGKLPATEVFVAAYQKGKICPQIFEVLGSVSDKSLYRWDKTLRENGGEWKCLCDSRGLWKKGGAKGLGQIGPEAEKAFLAAWLNPNKPTKIMAYRIMAVCLEKQGLPAPSITTVNRFARRYERHHQDMVTLMRDGEKALQDRVAGYIERDWNQLAVGDCLFCDGHTLNFESLHPATGRPHRATFICWFDAASRMPVGWEIMPTENTVAISTALRMAINNLRQIPRVVYLDNGKAFKAKYFTAETSFEPLKGLYASLGIAPQFAIPYNARAKMVERFFRTFDTQCQSLLPSYTGNTIDNKPAWRKRNEKIHQRRHNDFTPTIREVGEIIQRYVYWYGHQEHEGLEGRRPWDVFEAGLGPGNDPALDVHELNRHFQWSKRITPRRAGLTLFGVRYESQCLYGLAKPVVVKYSCADMNQIHIYDDDGHFLGEAKPVEFQHPLARHFGDDLDMLKLKEAQKEHALMKKSTLARARELELITGGAAAFEALPYLPKTAPKKAQSPLRLVTRARPAEPAKPEPVSPERAKEIKEQVARMIAKSEAVQKARPTFLSAFDRYEWCFTELYFKGQSLTDEEVKFMAHYEASKEYQEYTAPRYQQLRELCAGRRSEEI